MVANARKAGIYKLCWSDLPDCGYFYYGQSKHLYNRVRQHFWHLRNGTHDNYKLQRIYNKYGLPEVEIVLVCKEVDLNKHEQRLLDLFINHPDCCNIAPSADGKRGWKRRAESNAKVSAARLGKSLSADHRKKISAGLLTSYSDGIRKKPNLQGANNPFYNQKHTTESLSKMRGKSKGIGASNNTAKLTLNIETGIYYDYCGEAAMSVGINPQYLRRMLNGDRKNTTSFIYV